MLVSATAVSSLSLSSAYFNFRVPPRAPLSHFSIGEIGLSDFRKRDGGSPMTDDCGGGGGGDGWRTTNKKPASSPRGPRAQCGTPGRKAGALRSLEPFKPMLLFLPFLFVCCLKLE